MKHSDDNSVLNDQHSPHKFDLWNLFYLMIQRQTAVLISGVAGPGGLMESWRHVVGGVQDADGDVVPSVFADSECGGSIVPDRGKMCDSMYGGEEEGQEEGGEDEDEGPIDPRIQVELEQLNCAADSINKLENEVQKARAKFRLLKADSSRKLGALHKKIGRKWVIKARPYYDLLRQSHKAQLEAQKAAARFQRANSVYRAAKETVTLAEQQLLTEGGEKLAFDSAWQDMLNHATMRFMEAEKEKRVADRDHELRSIEYKTIQDKLNTIINDMPRTISKSKEFYELKDRLESRLQAEKQNAEDLHLALICSKQKYKLALSSLEAISEDVHNQRGRGRGLEGLPVRTPGVGAESDSWSEISEMPSITLDFMSETASQASLDDFSDLDLDLGDWDDPPPESSARSHSYDPLDIPPASTESSWGRAPPDSARSADSRGRSGGSNSSGGAERGASMPFWARFSDRLTRATTAPKLSSLGAENSTLGGSGVGGAGVGGTGVGLSAMGIKSRELMGGETVVGGGGGIRREGVVEGAEGEKISTEKRANIGGGQQAAANNNNIATVSAFIRPQSQQSQTVSSVSGSTSFLRSTPASSLVITPAQFSSLRIQSSDPFRPSAMPQPTVIVSGKPVLGKPPISASSQAAAKPSEKHALVATEIPGGESWTSSGVPPVQIGRSDIMQCPTSVNRGATKSVTISQGAACPSAPPPILKPAHPWGTAHHSRSSPDLQSVVKQLHSTPTVSPLAGNQTSTINENSYSGCAHSQSTNNNNSSDHAHSQSTNENLAKRGNSSVRAPPSDFTRYSSVASSVISSSMTSTIPSNSTNRISTPSNTLSIVNSPVSPDSVENAYCGQTSFLNPSHDFTKVTTMADVEQRVSDAKTTGSLAACGAVTSGSGDSHVLTLKPTEELDEGAKSEASNKPRQPLSDEIFV